MNDQNIPNLPSLLAVFNDTRERFAQGAIDSTDRVVFRRSARQFITTTIAVEP